MPVLSLMNETRIKLGVQVLYRINGKTLLLTKGPGNIVSEWWVKDLTKKLDNLVASIKWTIKGLDLRDNCKGLWLAPPHKGLKSDYYRGKLVGIFADITGLISVCLRHGIMDGSVEMVCDGEYALKVSQWSYKSHPVDRANSDLRKWIVCTKRRLENDFVINIFYTNTSEHQDEKVERNSLKHM